MKPNKKEMASSPVSEKDSCQIVQNQELKMWGAGGPCGS